MSSEAFAIYMFMGVVAGFFFVRWLTLAIVSRKPDWTGRLVAVAFGTVIGPILAGIIGGVAAKVHYAMTVAQIPTAPAQDAFRAQNPENIFGPVFVSFGLMLLIAPIASFVFGRPADDGAAAKGS